MIRLKLVMLLGFALMFVAGLAVGRSRKIVPAAKPPDTQPASIIGKELNLTPEQREQMKKIWEPVGHHPEPAEYKDADRQRDESIRALMSEDQRAQYELIIHDHDTKIAALRAEHETAMRTAEAESRAILTEAQQKTFDQMIKEHGHRHGPPGMHRGGKRNGPETAP
jgi:Spy/CpxP family protein refolding chaperone